jgi:hypothetical protein
MSREVRETATEIVVTARVNDVGSGAVSMTGWFVGPVDASTKCNESDGAGLVPHRPVWLTS